VQGRHFPTFSDRNLRSTSPYSRTPGDEHARPVPPHNAARQIPPEHIAKQHCNEEVHDPPVPDRHSMEPQQSPSPVQLPPDVRQQRARSGATRHDAPSQHEEAASQGLRSGRQAGAAPQIPSRQTRHPIGPYRPIGGWRGMVTHHQQFLQQHHRREGALLLPREALHARSAKRARACPRFMPSSAYHTPSRSSRKVPEAPTAHHAGRHHCRMRTAGPTVCVTARTRASRRSMSVSRSGTTRTPPLRCIQRALAVRVTRLACVGSPRSN